MATSVIFQSKSPILQDFALPQRPTRAKKEYFSVDSIALADISSSLSTGRERWKILLRHFCFQFFTDIYNYCLAALCFFLAKKSFVSFLLSQTWLEPGHVFIFFHEKQFKPLHWEKKQNCSDTNVIFWENSKK